MIRTPWNFSRTRVVQIDKKGKVVLGAVGEPWDGTNAEPMPALTANHGAMIPAPHDAVVSTHPPHLPPGL